MATIVVHFRDGTKREFVEKGRAGGSYCVSAAFKEGWLVVRDEWGHETAYPSDLVARVEKESPRGW